MSVASRPAMKVSSSRLVIIPDRATPVIAPTATPTTKRISRFADVIDFPQVLRAAERWATRLPQGGDYAKSALGHQPRLALPRRPRYPGPPSFLVLFRQ